MTEPSKLTPAELADHARSVVDYPYLDLGEDEYVVTDVRRGVIGLVFIWSAVLLVSVLFIVLITLLMDATAKTDTKLLSVAVGYLLVLLAPAGGFIASSIYKNNYLIVSNQRVFGRVQNAPFAKHIQSIELEHIEDTSYIQNGVLPNLFNYGTIRMSTVGDEHTYKITFVSDPASQIRDISRVVKQVDEGETTRYKKPQSPDSIV
jgi:hypothetical protein